MPRWAGARCHHSPCVTCASRPSVEMHHVLLFNIFMFDIQTTVKWSNSQGMLFYNFSTTWCLHMMSVSWFYANKQTSVGFISAILQCWSNLPCERCGGGSELTIRRTKLYLQFCHKLVVFLSGHFTELLQAISFLMLDEGAITGVPFQLSHTDTYNLFLK